MSDEQEFDARRWASDPDIASKRTVLCSKSRSIFGSHFVFYQLIRFTNEEVLVMMAAACWGSLVPIAYSPANDVLWVKAVVAVGAWLISAAVQIILQLIVDCLEKDGKLAVRHQALEFLIGILVWQPRVSWAMLGAGISKSTQDYVTDFVHSPSAGILASFILAYVLFLVGARVNYAALYFANKIWVYPLQTLAMSNLQMCAKICYVSWLGLSSRISTRTHATDHENVYREVKHSFWNLWFLLACTYVLHCQLKDNIQAAAADPGRTREAWRLQKQQWFICFVWASGFPDTSQLIFVDWIGGHRLGNTMYGVYLLYLWSIALLFLSYFAAIRVYLKGRGTTLFLEGGQASGLQWKQGQGVGDVHLSGVEDGSPAQRQGFMKFQNHRILEINGEVVQDAEHAHELQQATLQTQARNGSNVRMEVQLLFKSYQTTMDTIIEYMGETPAVFLSNGMNNMFWWAIQEQVMELWNKPHTKFDIVGGLKCYFLAISLTAVCVGVFSLNVATWERFLKRHGMQPTIARNRSWQMRECNRTKRAKLKNVVRFMAFMRSSKRVLTSSSLGGSSMSSSFLKDETDGDPSDDEGQTRQSDGIEHECSRQVSYKSQNETFEELRFRKKDEQLKDRMSAFQDDRSSAGPFMHVSPKLQKALTKHNSSKEAPPDLWEERLRHVLPNLVCHAPESAPDRKQWYRDVARWAKHCAEEE